jgi:hypothetical protein
MNTLSTRWAAIGSAVGLAGVLILTTLPSADDGTLAAIAAASTSFLLGNALTFLGSALIGAGLLVIGHHCTRHGHRASAALSRIAGVGWLLHTALIAHNAVSYELALLPDRTAATDLETQIFAGPVFLGLLLPMLALSVVGTIGTGIALWRAGHAPIWAAACLVLAMISDFVAPEAVSGVPTFVLLLAGFVGLRGIRSPVVDDRAAHARPGRSTEPALSGLDHG